MLPTVRQGLAQSQVRSLTVRFPSNRPPRPISTIPSLVSLKILDIEPLCYVDDISLLLAESKKLRELRIEWSPRMHEAKEPSINLDDMFARCRASKQTVNLTKEAMKHLFTLR